MNDMAFDASITLPPPSATIKSQPFSRANDASAITVDFSGFASIRSKITVATPALLEELAPLLAELEGLVRAPGTDVGESDFQLYPLLRSLSIVKALRFGPKVTAYYDAMGAACALEDFSAQAQ